MSFSPFQWQNLYHPLYLEPSSEELQVGGVVIGRVKLLQHLETGQPDLPDLVKQHPTNILQVVVSQELHTVGKGRGGGNGWGGEGEEGRSERTFGGLG